MPAKPKPFTARDVAVGNVVIRLMSAANTWIYRVSGGRIGGKFIGGAPLLLLTTIGRKSGKARTTPLIYMTDGSDLVVVASKGGMDEHPLWYTNLVANPEVEIELGKVRRTMRARTANSVEKARLWPDLVKLYASYQAYQERTERDIPVVILSPRPPPGG